MSSTILSEIKNGVAYLTLHRPDKLNAFNRQMALELQKQLDTSAVNPAVRCVYITGAGKGFSAGQDLSEVMGDNIADFDKILDEHYNPIITRIRKMEKPVLAAVNGVAAGAGANIALCCDIVVAAHSASFIQAFSKIGLIPDSGGTFFLPRLIGWQKASATMMLGDKITAHYAEQWGMVYKIFPDELFVESSTRIAETLAQLPTRALALTKQALNKSLTNSLADQLKAENEGQQQAANTYDYKEGVQAFLEKRKPIFKGE